MNTIITYGIIFIILLVLELCYFKIADKFDIIDKPNERSSHSTIVLRGGGIIFAIGLVIWLIWQVMDNGQWVIGSYGLFVLAVCLIAGVSFIDDITDLPDSLRLCVQFIAMAMMFYQLGLFANFNTDSVVAGIMVPSLIVLLALIVCVGASNIINFMDGINGITGVYAFASLIPLLLLNTDASFLTTTGTTSDNSLLYTDCMNNFIDTSLIVCVMIADVVFCIFNFRPKGKAKCFAGDVGSIGVAYILLFLIGSLIMKTGDVTYLIFLLVYGVDGVLTICHRIMLHENLGQAHRKHAFQLMANELKIGHVKVASFYAGLQLVISLLFIYVCPDNMMCHWMFLIGAIIILAIAYVVFMKKYYHLHEEYLASLKK